MSKYTIFSLEGDNKELNLVPIRSSRCAAERRYLKSTEPPKSPLPFAQTQSKWRKSNGKQNEFFERLFSSKRTESTNDNSEYSSRKISEFKRNFQNKESRNFSMERAKSKGMAKFIYNKIKLRSNVRKDTDLNKIKELNSIIKLGTFTHEHFLDPYTEAVIGDGIKYLDVNNEALQEHFKMICDYKAKNVRDCVLTINGFKEYILKRYCPNTAERLAYIMELPKKIRFWKYVECCNNLIRLSHHDKLKLCFGFYDHDFDERISVTDGLLMMK